MLMRLDADTSYLTDVVPAVVLFGLGMAMVVAPLTSSVLADADAEHAGVASGVNNAIARVAGLVAIAAVGAVVAAQFGTTLDDKIEGASGLSPAARTVAEQAKDRPLDPKPADELSGTQRAVVEEAVEDSAVEGFRVAAGASALLMLLGGIASAVGMGKPRRSVPCEDCPGGALVGASEEVARVRVPRPSAEPEPAPA
jgi:hypothetical protein